MAKNKTVRGDIPDTADRILTCEEVLKRIPLDRTTVWRLARAGRFPKPIQLTPARIGWRQSAVNAWVKDREEHPIEPRAYYKKPRG